MTQPLQAVTLEKIQEAVRRIIEKRHPRKIIMFGSQASGNARPDSDLDLMVVVDQVDDPARESVRLRGLLKGLLMAVDLVVVNHAKFEYWRDTPGNVYSEAARAGRLLYEAS